MAKITKMHIIGKEAKQVAEEQIKRVQREVDYDLRDFTIDYLVRQFTARSLYSIFLNTSVNSYGGQAIAATSLNR